MRDTIARAIFSVLIFILIFPACSNGDQVPPQLPTPINEAKKTISVIHDTFQGIPIVLAGSQGLNFIVSYQQELDGTLLTFEPLNNRLPVIMSDQEGNIWDIFGTAVDGPRKGQQLALTHSFMGFFFSFGAMYPGLQIYEGADLSAPENPPGDAEWLIPRDFIFQGAGFDAIPSLEFPTFMQFSYDENAQFYVDEHELVVGVSYAEEQKAYPHAVLDWHEIVNDKINDLYLSVIYCPLTGTATIWNSDVSAGRTTFGVSGLLYNSNVIPYDRNTGSMWTQIDEKCVNGELIGERPERIRQVETSWATWNEMFPDPQVLSEDTGFDRDYNLYPYGAYRSEDALLGFPLTFDDGRMHRKERVHAVIVDGEAKVYRFSSF